MRALLLITLNILITASVFACELAKPTFAYRTKGLDVAFINKTMGDYNSILWNFGDNTTSTESNPQHSYKEAGTYTFSLTIANATCQKIFSGKVYVFNTNKPTTIALNPAIENQTKEKLNTDKYLTKNGTVIDYGITSKVEEQNKTSLVSNIKNYPNPFETNTTITFELNNTSQINTVLYDIYGKIVQKNNNGVLESGQHQIFLERGNLAAGTYFFNIQTEKAAFAHLIMIQ